MHPPLRASVSEATLVRLLPPVALLWLAYSLLFFFADLVSARLPIPLGYYLLNAGTGVAVLILAWWPTAQARLGRALLPLVIGLLSVLPILSNYLLLPQFGPGGPTGAPARGGGPPPLPGPTLTAEGITLRLLPILLLAVVLTAWYYSRPQMIGYCLATSALCLGLRFNPLMTGGVAIGTGVARDGSHSVSPLVASLIVVGVQTLCLLIAGYFVGVLIGLLHSQQESLAEANRQLRRHAGTLESLTISRERNRVARELHDTLAHTLSGLSVQLEAVKAYWEIDPIRAQGVLDKAQNSARQGLHETRQALTALRATPLEDLGLGWALRQLAEAAAARAHLTLDLTLPDPLPLLRPDVEQCLYRVAQEAVANVIYHADARCLTVALCQDAAAVTLVIRDDGMGFAPDAVVSPGHFGLAGMRERARLVAGRLTINSHAGAGTTVHLQISEGVQADEGSDL